MDIPTLPEILSKDHKKPKITSQALKAKPDIKTITETIDHDIETSESISTTTNEGETEFLPFSEILHFCETTVTE